MRRGVNPITFAGVERPNWSFDIINVEINIIKIKIQVGVDWKRGGGGALSTGAGLGG